jgi:hypothetical protein
VLDQHKKTKINGENPYKDYLNSNVPITRNELSKKKFDNLRNNSINWIFDNIESLFFDYLLWFFEIDLSLYR